MTLIPKYANATMVKDYMPISYFTIIYKIICGTLTNRLNKVLNRIIHESQAAFILGMHLQDHIMMAFELIKDYSARGGPPKCILHMDLQKAYDIVEWHTVEMILKELGFLRKFIGWIMTIVSTVSYRFKVNGEYTEFLNSK